MKKTLLLAAALCGAFALTAAPAAKQPAAAKDLSTARKGASIFKADFSGKTPNAGLKLKGKAKIVNGKISLALGCSAVYTGKLPENYHAEYTIVLNKFLQNTAGGFQGGYFGNLLCLIRLNINAQMLYKDAKTGKLTGPGKYIKIPAAKPIKVVVEREKKADGLVEYTMFIDGAKIGVAKFKDTSNSISFSGWRMDSDLTAFELFELKK